MTRILTCAALLVSLICTCESLNAATMYLGNNENFTGNGTMYTVDIGSQSAAVLGSAGINFDFGGLGFAQDGTLYGWETSSDALYTVNTSNGQWSLVGGSGPSRGETFDINPVTNEAIVTDILSQLYTVTLATGASVLKVNLTNFQVGAGSAFGPDGTLYYLDILGDNLRSVDVSDGVVSLVGATGINDTFTNLSYNPEDGMLYAVATRGNSLYRFDPNNGAGANLGAIANLPDTGQYTMGTIRVPEPTTLTLTTLGLLAMCCCRRRRT